MRFDLVLKDLTEAQIREVCALAVELSKEDGTRPVAASTVVINHSDTRPPVHGMGPAPVVDTGPAPTAIFGSAPIPQNEPVVGSPVVAPVTTVQATAPIVSGEVDSSGMPWDARIHSSSRQKLAKGGGWKLRRGVDPAIVAAVEAELRGSVVAPVAPVVQQSYVQPQQAPVAAANVGTLTFPFLMSKVTTNMSLGKVKKESVLNILAQWGLKTTVDLVNRQELWAAFDAVLDAAIADPLQ